MFINFKTNTITKSIKIYSLEYKNKKIIDKTFNKLHKQKKCVILHNRRYLIIRCLFFNVTRSRQKKQTIIDIRDFNNIIIINNYSFLLQNNVILTIINFF